MIRSTVVTIAFGLNHRRAGLDMLEAVSLLPDARAKLLQDLLEPGLVRGAVVLATCHRLELYLDADRFHESFRVARDVLAIHSGADPALLGERLVPYFDREAVEHLFAVAAGLDSAVLGEHEILGQVRGASEAARNGGCMSPNLNLLFRRAVEAGKRVRTETALGRGTASISHAAVELAESVVGSLVGRRLVVVGAGEMGSGVAVAGAATGVSEVAVLNRHAERARELCDRLPPGLARPGSLADLDHELVEADVAVFSTGAQEPVVAADHLAGICAVRRGRPLVAIDVAMPRDVDPAARTLPGLTLLDLADLQAHCDRYLDQRRGALEEARAIVDELVERYDAERSSRTADPVVAALRQRADDVRRAELQRYLPRLSGLGERELDAVEALTKSMLAKLLHRPTVELKGAAGSAHGSRLAEAAVELFDLEP